MGPIANKPALLRVMAWCQTCDKPIPIMTSWRTYYFTSGCSTALGELQNEFSCGCKFANGVPIRADSRFASSQWETALLCNDVSHSLGASLESALPMMANLQYNLCRKSDEGCSSVMWNIILFLTQNITWEVRTISIRENAISRCHVHQQRLGGE